MKRYLSGDEWNIEERKFKPEHHPNSESLFSLGNGHMGQRANFEETYSGPSLQGNYLAGVYYPDKTRVGWWKNGYPEYFARVVNAPQWIGIRIFSGENELDLYRMDVSEFMRKLDMKSGILHRSFTASWPDGTSVRVETQRFLSMSRRELGAIRYRLTPVNFSGELSASLYLEGDVRNQNANYREKFWKPLMHGNSGRYSWLTSRTKKTGFEVCVAMSTRMRINGRSNTIVPDRESKINFAAHRYHLTAQAGETIEWIKLAAVTTSRDHPADQLVQQACNLLDRAEKTGFDDLKKEHINWWNRKWDISDIRIEGDLSAQQGIRFNIFHLNQTYTGHDPRLNIGPKGFTGEKYGGSTYWDTEAYCLPYYLNTMDARVARNLLLYRYHQLDKAIENAEKLGFTNGAALFPMVTMTGEECHNEWEITFEEIHRNGAIAYAIFNYIRHTGDRQYLVEYGLEVLIALSRFWVQRVNFSSSKQQFVILGVTGPNEYENNVNNNWYTNLIAVWTLNYTLESLEYVQKNAPRRYEEILKRTHFDLQRETARWKSIADHTYFPEDKELGIFLQQEGYLDKEQILSDEVPEQERPVNQHWSWDRILRSSLIKQADVLQGIYFFESYFDLDIIRRNFDFYEPRTLHESSLSPCVHVILAAKLRRVEKAYELYLRTSRLDLDDYNNEVDEGCHITSMAGTWLSVIEGFGGMRVVNHHLSFNPLLPESWKSLEFSINFRGNRIRIIITRKQIELTAANDEEVTIQIANQTFTLSGREPLKVSFKA